MTTSSIPKTPDAVKEFNFMNQDLNNSDLNSLIDSNDVEDYSPMLNNYQDPRELINNNSL